MIEQTPPNPANGGPSDPPVGRLVWQTNRFGERVLESVNGQAFDKLGARLTLAEAFRGQFEAQDTLYLVAGSDSGHLIDHVKRLSAPRGTRYLFIDPPAVYHALAAEGLLDDLPAHIRCAPADGWTELAHALRLSDYLYIDRVEVVFSLAATSPDVTDYVELAWGLREAVAALRWQAVTTRGSEAFIACQLDNAADCAQSAAVWRGALAGRTGVLLAGGPSLDAALDWVRRHRAFVVVLAVSRISRRLLDVGLEPDFVLSVDPTEMSYEISRDMLRFSASVIFVHQYHVNPRLLGQWPHRNYYLGRILPWTSPLNPTDPLHGVGPTVTNTALEFAGALGLSRVILAGVDLCFTPEGYTHAQGSNERKVGPRFDLTELEVETNDGRRASTTADFASAAQMLGKQAQLLRAGGMDIVNSAPGAARITSIEYRSLEDIEILDPPLPRPLRVAQETDTPQWRLRHARAVIREMQRKLDEIARLEIDLRDARRIVAKLFQADGTIANRNLRKRLDRLEADIEARYPDTAALIRQCGTHAFLRAMRSTQDVDTLDATAVRDTLAAYYDTYLDGASRLRQHIRHGIERARLRVRENDGATPLPELAPQWLALKEPGRLLRWLAHHPTPPDRTPPSGISETIAALQQAWEGELNQEGGRHLARARQHADLSAARTRLEHLFAQRKIDGIRNLILGLERAPDQTAANPYLALARGHLAELEDRVDDALSSYESVLQSSQRELWTPALLRIAHWALRQGHADHARQALQCLADLSPRYRTALGDMLAAMGQLTEAITQYQLYLQTHPHDYHAMARLVRVLLHAGATEAAHILLGHLEREPAARAIATELRGLSNPTT